MSMPKGGHGVSDLDVRIAKACTSTPARSRENDIPLLAVGLDRESVVRVAEVLLDDDAR